MNKEYKKRFENAVWGFVVGDALGVPYEFCSREEMDLNPITCMDGHGTYNQPLGTWSDDTSMMLCVIEYFIEEGEKDRDYWLLRGLSQQRKLADKFIDWYTNASYTSNNEVFDIGMTTRAALDKIIETKSVKHSGESNPEIGCGNGALMRCFPIAYFHAESRIPLRNLLVTRIGSITHNTLLSHLCCSFYTEMFFGLMKGYTKEEAYQHARKAISYILRQEDFIEESVVKTLEGLYNSLGKLSRDKIKSGGYVIHTLEAAIWSFLNTDNYQDAVFTAINLGGDTDTIGALTGALAGCHYGEIREDWKNEIVNKGLIENLMSKITI